MTGFLGEKKSKKVKLDGSKITKRVLGADPTIRASDLKRICADIDHFITSLSQLLINKGNLEETHMQLLNEQLTIVLEALQTVFSTKKIREKSKDFVEMQTVQMKQYRKSILETSINEGISILDEKLDFTDTIASAIKVSIMTVKEALVLYEKHPDLADFESHARQADYEFIGDTLKTRGYGAKLLQSTCYILQLSDNRIIIIHRDTIANSFTDYVVAKHKGMKENQTNFSMKKRQTRAVNKF